MGPCRPLEAAVSTLQLLKDLSAAVADAADVVAAAADVAAADTAAAAAAADTAADVADVAKSCGRLKWELDGKRLREDQAQALDSAQATAAAAAAADDDKVVADGDTDSAVAVEPAGSARGRVHPRAAAGQAGGRCWRAADGTAADAALEIEPAAADVGAVAAAAGARCACTPVAAQGGRRTRHLFPMHRHYHYQYRPNVPRVQGS